MTSLLALAHQQRSQTQQHHQPHHHQPLQRNETVVDSSLNLQPANSSSNNGNSASSSTLLQRERTGHIIIPADIALPGTANSLLMIFFEENLNSAKEKRTARDAQGRTCLHLAVLKVCPIAFVRDLIEDVGLDVNGCDYSGNTSLHIACAQKAHEHAKLLLSHGANSSLMNGSGEVAETSFLNREFSVQYMSASHRGESFSSSPLLQRNTSAPTNLIGSPFIANMTPQHSPSSPSSACSSPAPVHNNKSENKNNDGTKNEKQNLGNNFNQKNDGPQYLQKSRVVERQASMTVIDEHGDELPHYLPNRLITERISLFSNSLFSGVFDLNVDGGGEGNFDLNKQKKKMQEDHLALIQEAARVARMEVAVPLVPVPWKSAPSSCIDSLDSRTAYTRRKSSIASILQHQQKQQQQQQQSPQPKHQAVLLAPQPPSQDKKPRTQQTSRLDKLRQHQSTIKPTCLHPLQARSNAALIKKRKMMGRRLHHHGVKMSYGDEHDDEYEYLGGGSDHHDHDDGGDSSVSAGSSRSRSVSPKKQREVLDGIFVSSNRSDRQPNANREQDIGPFDGDDDDENENSNDAFARSKKYYRLMAENKKTFHLAMMNVGSTTSTNHQQQQQQQHHHSSAGNDIDNKNKNAAIEDSKRKQSVTTVLQSTLPVWFAIIPRVSEHEVETSFLIGGMVRFHGEFQFEGRSFCLSETETHEEIFCARFSSTLRSREANNDHDSLESRKNNHQTRNEDVLKQQQDEEEQRRQQEDPIVLELFTATKDTSLPTVVRCFRDTQGLVASHETKKELQRQSNWAKKKAQMEAKNAVDDKRSDDAIMIQSSESKAGLLLIRFMTRLKYLNKFQNIITLLADRTLRVKRFLLRCVHRIKFAKCVLFFIASSFFRYALNELDKIPRCGSAMYKAITRTMRSFVQTFSDQRFVSKNLLFIAVDAAFRARQKRIMNLLRGHRNVPLDIVVQHRRERFIWCLSLEEIIHCCCQPMARSELLPVMSVVQTRDGLLPRELLYSIRQLPNSKEVFEDLARGKLERTLIDIVKSFSAGRRNYFEDQILSFGRNRRREQRHNQNNQNQQKVTDLNATIGGSREFLEPLDENATRRNPGSSNQFDDNEMNESLTNTSLYLKNREHDDDEKNDSSRLQSGSTVVRKSQVQRPVSTSRSVACFSAPSPFRRPSPYLQKDFHRNDRGDVFGLMAYATGEQQQSDSGALISTIEDDENIDDNMTINGRIIIGNTRERRKRDERAMIAAVQEQQYVEKVLKSLQRKRRSPPAFGTMSALILQRKKKQQLETRREATTWNRPATSSRQTRITTTTSPPRIICDESAVKEEEGHHQIVETAKAATLRPTSSTTSKILTRFPPIVALGKMKRTMEKRKPPRCIFEGDIKQRKWTIHFFNSNE